MIKRVTLLLILISLLMGSGVGCHALGGAGRGVQYEEQHGPFSGQIVAIDISRRVLDQAVSKGDSANALRMVEVFRRAEEAGANYTPQYRLFDIQKGSVYDLVGLKNNDVLLAADGLVIFDAPGFKTFVSTLLRAYPDGKISEIFVSRAGVPIRLQLKTVA